MCVKNQPVTSVDKTQVEAFVWMDMGPPMLQFLRIESILSHRLCIVGCHFMRLLFVGGYDIAGGAIASRMYREGAQIAWLTNDPDAQLWGEKIHGRVFRQRIYPAAPAARFLMAERWTARCF